MILDDIVCSKRVFLENQKKIKTLDCIIHEIEKSDQFKNRGFKDSLSKKGLSVIGEIKKASPSKGIIVDKFNPADIALLYEKISVDAVSVITEEDYFMGRPEYIKTVRKVISKPVLRKDFIIDEYQIYEARLLKADAVLLIAGILKDKLKRFYNLSYSLGIQCIVEVHNQEELYNALEVNPDIIGVNNRNLENFTVNLKNTEQLMKYIPNDTVVVSESGIMSHSDFKYIKDLKVDAVLVGEGFMRKMKDLNTMRRFMNMLKSTEQEVTP